jgi:multidrug efflux pump subunit AcrA (membrane-fusion protein)
MAVWRRWIFPILMVLVFGVIAASLAKLAFFSSDEASRASPSAGIADPIVAVERGSVVNELALTGTIARDEEVAIRSGIEGTVTAVHVGSGAEVWAGQPLFTVRREDPLAVVDVVASEAGRLGDVALVAGQAVSLGAELVKLSPARYHVLSTVQPVQLYRLLNAPGEGTVAITGGPAPFACTGLTTQVASDGTTSVRCSVPADQIVFPGLPVALSIAIGTAEDVLVIPTTAVKGGASSGLVWIDAGDGAAPAERSVRLGVSDGSVVEVLEGLEEGEAIRQFVPGSAAPVEEFCYEIAPGQEHCETGAVW